MNEIVEFEKAIYFILTGSSALQNYINIDNIYVLTVDEDLSAPFIVYKIDGKPEYHKDGIQWYASLQMKIVDTDFSNMKNIVKEINNIFSNLNKINVLEYFILQTRIVDYTTDAASFEKTKEYLTDLEYEIIF